MLDESMLKLLQNKNYKAFASVLFTDNDLLQDLIFHYFKSEDLRFVQAFSNVLEQFKKNNQSLLAPFYQDCILLLEQPHCPAIHRNTYRYFQDVNIPEQHEGILYDFAFNDLQNIENAIAIRAFAMTTCFNIAKKYPDLLVELKDAILFASISDSPGIKSRSKNLIKKIDKLLDTEG